MLIADAIQKVKRTKLSLAITTDFGVVDISRKEALRMLETCEMSKAFLSESPGTLILEYPE